MSSAKTVSPRKKKIRNAIGTVLIILLVVLIVVILYSRVTGKRIFPYTLLWVLTDSMESQIPARSYILVETVDAKDVEVGDVITFHSRDPQLAGSLNSHRVVSVNADHTRFTTKGDHNEIADAYEVYAEDIVARYVCNLPFLSYLGRLFATPGGLVVTLILLMGIMGIWLSVTTRKLDKSTKNNEIERRIAEEVARMKTQGISTDGDTGAPQEQNKN